MRPIGPALLPKPDTALELPLPPAAEQGESGLGLSLTQVLFIVQAYWKYAAVLAVSIIALGGVLIKLLPKSYTATSTLKVNLDIKDPLAGENAQGNTQAMGYIPTEMQLMVSSEILLPVIDKLKLTEDKTYTAGYSGTPANLRYWIKERLIKDLEIEQGSQSSFLIYVTATARTPLRAAEIANAVADSYMEQERLRIDDPAADRARRYAGQLAELKSKVSVAEDQLTQFRQRTGITDPAVQKNVEMDALAALEQRLEASKIALHESQVRVTADPALNAESTAAHSRLQELRGVLYGEEAQLAQLRTTLGPAHPKVIELQAQITALKQRMDTELKMYTEGAVADNTSQQRLVQSLQRSVDDQRARVLSVGKLLDEGNKYVLELESAKSVYKRALDGYDQIMFAWRGHYTYVELVGRAEPPLKSTKPNKIKLFLMVMAAGLGIGAGVPLGYELFLNRRVRCRDDIERGLGVPVLIEMRYFAAVPASAA